MKKREENNEQINENVESSDTSSETKCFRPQTYISRIEVRVEQREETSVQPVTSVTVVRRK